MKLIDHRTSPRLADFRPNALVPVSIRVRLFCDGQTMAIGIRYR
jgi:hypothetical protein